MAAIGPIALLGLAIGFAGPFGTIAAMAPVARYAFWLAMVAAGYGSAHLVAAFLRPKWQAAQPLWLRKLAISLASAIPMTLLVAWLLPLIRPGRTISPMQMPLLFLSVAVIQAIIVWLLLAEDRPAAQHLPDKATRADYADELRAKLPPHVTEILALEAQDHYLRVHLPGKDALIHMGLNAAIAAIRTDIGIRCHRRWWVAHSAIDCLERDGASYILRLNSGQICPVGRSYIAAVRSARPSTPRE